jgi:glycosyltransferase involved in cell wall biosynthesis
VELDAFERDEYAHTKLVQERLVRDHATRAGWDYTIIRPGVIYGADNLLDRPAGGQGNRLWIRIGAWAKLPLTYVENCAEAIVLSAERDAARGQVLNIVDDETPTQRRYLSLLRRQTSPRPFVVPVAYSVMRFLAGSASLTNKYLLGGRAKVPGIFVPAKLVARAKPLNFTNEKAKRVLGWVPRYSLSQALERSAADEAQGKAKKASAALREAGDTAAHPGRRGRGEGGGVTIADALNPRIASAPLRIAYMTGEYPRATDTFIQREIAALRNQGVHVETFSVRKPAMKENVGPEQKAERERTFYVLPFCPWELVKSHANLLVSEPKRYFSALRTALFVRSAGLKALVWQGAYFAEAGVIASRVRKLGLTHLHNHFSNSSCSVAMLAAELGGFTYSFTMHGPAEFYEPKYWRIDEKIKRARFVACISHFCRSQAMVFSRQDDWDKLHIVHCGVTPADFPARDHAAGSERLLFVGRLAGREGAAGAAGGDGADRQEPPPPPGSRSPATAPTRARLELQAAQLGIASKVDFLGYQSQQQVRELLGAHRRVRHGQLCRGRAGRADGGDGGRRAGRGDADRRNP